MREPAVLSRRAAAALPLAALIRPAATAHVAPAPANADAALLELGRRWAAAWDAQVAHGRTYDATMSAAAAQAHDEAGDRLYAAEQALFDAIVALPARTVGGLAVKGEVLARAHDVDRRGIEAVQAAAASAWDPTTRAALSLVVDTLRMGGLNA